MVRSFCASGNHEGVKCGVHAAAAFIVSLCAVYNTTAWFYRRDPHLRINAIFYTLALAYELKQTMHHLNAPQRCVPQPVIEEAEAAA
jgi:hypothetical protein